MSLIVLRTDCNGSNHYSYFSLHLSHFFLPSTILLPNAFAKVIMNHLSCRNGSEKYQLVVELEIHILEAEQKKKK